MRPSTCSIAQPRNVPAGHVSLLSTTRLIAKQSPCCLNAAQPWGLDPYLLGYKLGC